MLPVALSDLQKISGPITFKLTMCYADPADSADGVAVKNNALCYGDNLDVLRRYIRDESVDLIYLDPPFNSNANYNVLFAEKSGEKAHAQITAFEDTWTWDHQAAAEYQEVMQSGHDRLSKCLFGIYGFLGGSDMMAYLSMMALRLIELRRVPKPTGSIYLHCDPTASHYLKLLMDAVFGPENFLNEIIWKRTSAHNSARRFGPVHDVILFYCQSHRFEWYDSTVPHDPSYVEDFFRSVEPGSGRKYHANVLTGAGVRHGESGLPWRGYDPTAKGRHWALPGKFLDQLGVSKSLTVQQKLDSLHAAGRIYVPEKDGGQPRVKYYADELRGQPTSDVWSDIGPISSKTAERLGYPTQKPELLLERILEASSAKGQTVLDPFCGCGTTVAAAQKLGRQWIGIDVTHLAIGLIKGRLLDSFGLEVAKSYETIGEPEDLASAQQLADDDKYQFQYWALGLVGARPVEQKKGADRGVDGRLYFNDSASQIETKEIIISVKGGHVTVNQVRDLRGVIERDKAVIGVFICIEPPTKPMIKEAADAGFYKSPQNTKHPRLQIITIEQLLAKAKIDMPPWRELRTFKVAKRVKQVGGEQLLAFN